MSTKSKALTFLVGLAVASATVGIIVRKNPKLRKEIEGRLEEALQFSRETLKTGEEALEKIQKLTEIISTQKERRVQEKERLAAITYQKEWEKHIWDQLSRTF